MKKIPFLKLILPLILVFLAFSCTFNHLKHEVTIDDEPSSSVMFHLLNRFLYCYGDEVVEASHG